jgi:hypothetical protein
MKYTSSTGRGLLCACISVLLTASTLAEISETVLVFDIRNEEGFANLKVLFDEGKWDETKQLFSWDLPAPITFVNPLTNVEIGKLKSLKLRMYVGTNPRINLDYAVEAGASTTAFYFTPGQVLFDTPEGWLAEGKARASVTVVDKNENGVNLSATGKAGNAVFLGQYNGEVPYGKTFTGLLGTVAAGPGGSASVSQNDPSYGYRAISGKLTDISAQMRFLLSSKDVSDGSFRYNIRLYQP